jgi:hypothetical protein
MIIDEFKRSEDEERKNKKEIKVYLSCFISNIIVVSFHRRDLLPSS